MNNRRITQIQIAKAAGVSKTTVSLIMSGNNDQNISQDTRERVMAIAAELGYIFPNTATNILQMKNIGYITPRETKDAVAEAHLADTRNGIMREVEKRGYHLLIAPHNPEMQLPEFVQQCKVEGLLVDADVDADWINRVSAHVPVVMLNGIKLFGTRADFILSDFTSGIYKIIRHLHNLGHRQIALFGLSPTDSQYIHPRVEAYNSIMHQFGLDTTDEYISLPMRIKGDLDEVTDFARESLQKWCALPIPPTAVVCLNDVYALGFLKAALYSNIHIPEDISVTGFDNSISGEYSIPALTTVSTLPVSGGRIAANLLFDKINNPERHSLTILNDVEIVIRESTGPVSKTAINILSGTRRNSIYSILPK
jgi:LacI family transcriptional regulator